MFDKVRGIHCLKRRLSEGAVACYLHLFLNEDEDVLTAESCKEPMLYPVD